MKVGDIGLKEVHCANPSATLDEVAGMMKRHGVGVIPVCNDGKIIGMITDRDIAIGCVAAGIDPHTCQAREFMTSHPVTVSPDVPIEEAARIMGKEQIHRMPVVEDDKLVGMLSLGDLSVALLGNDSLVAETLRKISTPAQAVLPCA
ncbi:MAG: CBS domain-containing protein [Chloroflexi bacterium]|nr:CBS domain-containing protein [Chloroflexota bacterium]